MAKFWENRRISYVIKMSCKVVNNEVIVHVMLSTHFRRAIHILVINILDAVKKYMFHDCKKFLFQN